LRREADSQVELVPPHLIHKEVGTGRFVDMTQDRLPHAGEKDGLFYSMGYSGHGTQMSVHMGECMARVMAGTWRPIPGATTTGRPSPATSARPGSWRSWACTIS